jgi:hypothetical protein
MAEDFYEDIFHGEELDAWDNPPVWQQNFMDRESYFFTTSNPTEREEK